ncbi:MAG: phytanoyl-CoA dioxygenase family protein [Planctomycetes bacterium]|nr:phytanoyl-CoA dioxygenase family protein [Planctomycetota bacterium]
MIGELTKNGFVWLRGLLTPEETAAWRERLERVDASLPRDGERSYAGVRIPLDKLPEARELLALPSLAPLLERALSGMPRLVRVLLFDKSGATPWFVRWHRDTMIPVKEHRPSTVLTAPSVKAGVPHVRATTGILSKMLALRLHLDSSTPDNGPLKVLLGSHAIASLAAPEAALPENRNDRAVTCLAEPGDLLLMRPLLLHASPKPANAARRRVLQLEISGPQVLPDRFEWHE